MHIFDPKGTTETNSGDEIKQSVSASPPGDLIHIKIWEQGFQMYWTRDQAGDIREWWSPGVSQQEMSGIVAN